ILGEAPELLIATPNGAIDPTAEDDVSGAGGGRVRSEENESEEQGDVTHRCTSAVVRLDTGGRRPARARHEKSGLPQTSPPNAPEPRAKSREPRRHRPSDH